MLSVFLPPQAIEELEASQSHKERTQPRLPAEAADNAHCEAAPAALTDPKRLDLHESASPRAAAAEGARVHGGACVCSR